MGGVTGLGNGCWAKTVSSHRFIVTCSAVWSDGSDSSCKSRVLFNSRGTTSVVAGLGDVLGVAVVTADGYHRVRTNPGTMF